MGEDRSFNSECSYPLVSTKPIAPCNHDDVNYHVPSEYNNPSGRCAERECALTASPRGPPISKQWCVSAAVVRRKKRRSAEQSRCDLILLCYQKTILPARRGEISVQEKTVVLSPSFLFRNCAPPVGWLLRTKEFCFFCSTC